MLSVKKPVPQFDRTYNGRTSDYGRGRLRFFYSPFLTRSLPSLALDRTLPCVTLGRRCLDGSSNALNNNKRRSRWRRCCTAPSGRFAPPGAWRSQLSVRSTAGILFWNRVGSLTRDLVPSQFSLSECSGSEPPAPQLSFIEVL